MKLITKEIAAKLSKNIGDANVDMPYLKLFSPVGAATWLISEYDEETGNLFGLCDLGMGFPELGSVSLHELESITLPMGLGIERDKYFEPTKTLAEYASAANKSGYINTNGGE
jgi:hypothetical protein